MSAESPARPPVPTPSHPPPAPRKRRSAALNAVSKIAPPAVFNKYLDSVMTENSNEARAEEEEEASVHEIESEEESESSSKRSRTAPADAADVIRRQRTTIKRLEEDVNNLKRQVKEDKARIEHLGVALREAKPMEKKAEDTKLLDKLAELVLYKHFELLRQQEMKASYEKSLEELHKKAYVSCTVCQTSAGSVALDHPSHVVCLACLETLSAEAKKDDKGVSYFPCPVCRAKICNVNLSAFSIATSAGGRLECWLPKEDELRNPMFLDIASRDRDRVRASLIRSVAGELISMKGVADCYVTDLEVAVDAAVAEFATREFVDQREIHID